MKFPLGQLIVTPKARAVLKQHGQRARFFLDRHQAGDWGEVAEQEREVNERGLRESFNLQSVYVMPSGERLMVVTMGDRSRTTVHIDPRQA